MSNEFLIGNGYVFETKDVLNTVRVLDSEYKTIIVETIAESLMAQVAKGVDPLAEDTDKNIGKIAFETLKEINRAVSLAYSHVKSKK